MLEESAYLVCEMEYRNLSRNIRLTGVNGLSKEFSPSANFTEMFDLSDTS